MELRIGKKMNKYVVIKISEISIIICVSLMIIIGIATIIYIRWIFYEFDINDIHTSNIGFIAEDEPIIIDYSGYY